MNEFTEHEKLITRIGEINLLADFFRWCASNDLTILNVKTFKNISTEELMSGYFIADFRKLAQESKEISEFLKSGGTNNSVNS